MRARAILITPVVAVLVAAGLGGCGGDDDTQAGAGGTTTTSSSTTSSTTPTPTPAEATSSSTTATTKEAGGHDTPPEKRCVDASSGPVQPVADDWGSRWQTKPEANDPVTMTICIDDATPAVGQTVRLTLTADDPDAKIVEAECGWFVTWQDDHDNLCRDFLLAGVHPTPAEEPGHVEVSDTHVYTQPGSFTIIASVWSAEYVGYTSPYSSYVEANIPVQVHPTLVVD
jgi:hypothetical protein